MKILFVFFFLLNPCFSQERIHLLTKDGVELQGKHFANEGGKPILLLHGFMESFHIWSVIDQHLYHEGYDVYLFNLRGHGNEEEKSRPKLSYSRKTPTMGFDEIIAYDLPTIINFIQKKTKKKVTIIGHSMGGMSSRLFVSGLQKDKNDTMKFSQRASSIAKKKISKIIAIASPSHFKNTSQLIRDLWPFGERYNYLIRKVMLSSLLSQRGPDERNLLTQLIDDITEFGIKFPLVQNALKAIFSFENFEEKEFSDFIHRQVSVPHQDLFDDSANWIRRGIYTSRSGRMDYSNFYLPNNLPYTMIGLSRDGLADLTDIEKDYASQGNRPDIKFIRNDDFNHVDVVATKEGKRFLLSLLPSLL